jgi:hypothetical protein
MPPPVRQDRRVSVPSGFDVLRSLEPEAGDPGRAVSGSRGPAQGLWTDAADAKPTRRGRSGAVTADDELPNTPPRILRRSDREL